MEVYDIIDGMLVSKVLSNEDIKNQYEWVFNDILLETKISFEIIKDDEERLTIFKDALIEHLIEPIAYHAYERGKYEGIVDYKDGLDDAWRGEVV